MDISKYLSITRAPVEEPVYALKISGRLGFNSTTLYIRLEELKALVRYGMEELRNGGKLPQKKEAKPKLVLLKGGVDEQ